jgi:palmitoyltransferase
VRIFLSAPKVLEFAVNDPPSTAMNSPGRRTYEQLLRKLLRLGPAVVMLHQYAYSVGRSDGGAPGSFWSPTEQHLSTFARFYDVTSISVAAAAWRLMVAGVDGFKLDKYAAGSGIHPTNPNLLAKGDERALYFYADRVHPSDTGHKVLAETLAAPLLRAVGEVQALQRLPPAVLQALLLPPSGGGGSYIRRDERVLEIPPPMLPGNQEQRTLICALQADFKQLVKAASGFQYRAEKPNATDVARQKWAWSSNKPGITLTAPPCNGVPSSALTGACLSVATAIPRLFCLLFTRQRYQPNL